MDDRSTDILQTYRDIWKKAQHNLMCFQSLSRCNPPLKPVGRVSECIQTCVTVFGWYTFIYRYLYIPAYFTHALKHTGNIMLLVFSWNEWNQNKLYTVSVYFTLHMYTCCTYKQTIQILLLCFIIPTELSCRPTCTPLPSCWFSIYAVLSGLHLWDAVLTRGTLRWLSSRTFVSSQ